MPVPTGALLQTVLLIALIFSICGCSVGMALSGATPSNISKLYLGTARNEILETLGDPQLSQTINGKKVDMYLISKGNEINKKRAVGHALIDVASLGLWEIVGTPYEAKAAETNSKRYFITYNQDNAIEDIIIMT